MKVTGSPTLMYFKPSVNVTVSPGLIGVVVVCQEL